MTISRMQQPRQMYGLGSLVKKAVKGVKDFVKSDIGKATILGVGAFGLPGGALGMKGLISSPAVRSFIPNLLYGKEMGVGKRSGDGLFGMFSNMGNFGKAATMFGVGALGGGALAALEAAGLDTDNPNEMPRDIEALKAYLRQGYKQLNQDASPEQVEAFVTANTTEYAANGGRIGFADGMPREGIETLLPKPKPSEMMQGVDKTIQSIDNFAQLIAQSGSPSDMRGHMDLFSDFIQKNNVDAGPAFQYLKNRVKELKPGMERYIYISNEDMPVQKAMGGRINYSGGGTKKKPIDIQASGSITGDQQIYGAPAGITSNKQVVNAILKLDIPISEKINLIGDYEYGKFRDKIKYNDKEIYLEDPGSYKNRKIGLNYNEGGEGFSGYGKYNIDTGEKEGGIKFIKKFNEGGRVGLKDGGRTITLMDGTKVYIPSGSTTSSGGLKDQIYSSSKGDLLREEILAKMLFSDGGRAKYAFGSPEENAMQASGIGGLPLNQNPAGITELDLRDSGGFIPPVGVKEKADDIPAMLSNNEFVFTADAVRGMGDGDVEKGAQRMYDMMKKLEGGGRV